MTPREMDEARPRVVVSQCLGFAAVRYNGEVLQSRWVDLLRRHVDFVQVCPEVGIGLGVPRDPVHVEEDRGRLRLIQPDTGRDLTEDMRAFSEGFLAESTGVDGFILKAKSPSCGLHDTKVFEAGSARDPLRRESGLFAGAVLQAFPEAAVQDEARLAEPRFRHNFLTHLWALARLRRVEASDSGARLREFHASYEPVLSGLPPGVRRSLDRIVAGLEGLPARDRTEAHRSALGKALAESGIGEGAALENGSAPRSSFIPYPAALRERVAEGPE